MSGSAAARVFTGGGSLRALCRDLDWGSTPLGPVESWPTSLRTAAGIVMGAGFPGLLLWGAELIQIYNDAYAPILGDNHPRALGSSRRKTVPDLWHLEKPVVDRVLLGDKGLLEDRVHVRPRNGSGSPAADAFLTHWYSPVVDEAGRVAGVFIVLFDTTEQVEARGLRGDRDRLDRALEVERARLVEVFRQAPSFLAVLRGPSHEFEYVNDSYSELIGHRQVVGRPLLDALPEVRGQGFKELLDGVLATGRPYVGRETPAMVVRGPDNHLEQVFVDFIYQPFVEPDGSVTGVVVHGSVVTEQVRSRRALERLLAESETSRTAISEANTQLQEQQMELELSNQQLQDQAAELEMQAEELHAAAAGLARRTEEAERSASALAEGERQWRTMLDAIPTLAWTAKADGYIDWYNSRWYEYTGTTPADMAGWGWQSVHDPVMLPQVLERWRLSIATGRPFEMTFPLRGADGTFRPFLTRVSPILDSLGAVARWFGTNTDVEGEHSARTAAERANQAKTDFLATMSHELRTPLNAIAGYAELLEIGVHGPVTDQQREAINRIQRSQRHLLSVINDILNFAKLEAGRVEYTVSAVPVREVIDAIEPLVAPQIRAKGLHFSRDECAAPLVVRADPEKLQQILVNLLSNAIKFTPNGGTISLRCRSEGSDIVIAVEDTGIGIPADRLAGVFEPFVQIDRRLNSPHEGTGLGLAISRDLARGMGGELEARSVVGAGSVFTLRLPMEGVT